MDNNEQVIFVFSTSCSPYSAGEKASFTRAQAAKLKAKGAGDLEENLLKKKEEVNVNSEPDADNKSDTEESKGGTGKKTTAKKKGSTKRRVRVKADD